MEIYITTMQILSLFGIFTLILSLYIFIVVPTKLSVMFRAALLGNCLSSCSLQIFLSLGTIPSFLLPCFAFYTNGLMKYTGLSTFVQAFIQGFIFGLAGWFVVYICLLRAVAVSVYLTERRKTQITVFFTFLSFLNLLLCLAVVNRLEIPEDGRLFCSKMFNNHPPPELFMSETLVVSIKADSYVAFLVCFCILSISVYTMIGGISTIYLIWSLKMHSAKSSSSKILESQRKLTFDILKLILFQALGLVVPPIGLMFCILNSISSKTGSEILLVMLAISPNIACIQMLRLIPAYKESLNKICLSILPVKLMKRITTLEPQTVSVQPSVIRSTSTS